MHCCLHQDVQLLFDIYCLTLSFFSLPIFILKLASARQLLSLRVYIFMVYIYEGP